jgi:CxxC motif-containing protein (DUF1111 family)
MLGWSRLLRLVSLLPLVLGSCRDSRGPNPGEPFGWIDSRERAAFERGRATFVRTFTAKEGLGPLYNGAACIECHSQPAAGGEGQVDNGVRLVAVRGAHELGTFFRHSTQGEPPPPPDGAAVFPAKPPSLFGLGLFDGLTEDELRAECDPTDRDGDGVRGHVVLRRDGRLGRFGHKAHNASLKMMAAIAASEEMGLTNPMQSKHGADGDAAPDPELSAQDIRDLADFIRYLAPPAPTGESVGGERVFETIGCAACHKPSLAGGKVRGAYTDLCVHSMGPTFDALVREDAYDVGPDEWRTAPLWGLHLRPRFLHDDRAGSVREAIEMHGGEAQGARDRFLAASSAEQALILSFLASR